MGLETVSSRMNKLGRSMLNYGRVITPEDNVADLAKVTLADIKQLAEEMFRKEAMEITILGAVDEIQI